jgi:hypothetical protein
VVSEEGQLSMQLVVDCDALGRSIFEVCHQLKKGEPGVFPNENLLEANTLIVSPVNLNNERTQALTIRLREVLNG